ncbi:hypothetical protein [Haliangium sp.]|uniref:hypothetical protein n=1 Tax=Haliangium sp. TaxID=2663208 RepID=UPI003D0BCA56
MAAAPPRSPRIVRCRGAPRLRYSVLMRLRPLLVCVLVLCGSCRLFVDPNEFSDDDRARPDGGDQRADAAGALDADPARTDSGPSGGGNYVCDWAPKFIDPSGMATNGDLVLSGGAYEVRIDGDRGRIVTPSAPDETVAELRLVTQRDNTNDAWLLLVDSLMVKSGTTLRAQSSTATAPLFVVANTNIIIEGTIDASSTTEPRVVGLGANPSVCGRDSQNGAPGAGAQGGGGGGGGFGEPGGTGGEGNDGAVGGRSGEAVGSLPDNYIRGGCPGGDGGGSTFPGNGGGAIHLTACGGISVAASGLIHVSGQGGAGGRAGTPAGGTGGGGGGSGGYIGLEAPMVSLMSGSPGSRLIANGGGGGGGGGTLLSGTAGGDGRTNGGGVRGNGAGDAGDGGLGGFSTVAAEAGQQADSVLDGAAGGGGGGSVGWILIRANNTDDITMQISTGDITPSPEPEFETL